MEELDRLMKEFKVSVQDGTHSQKGYSNSNYGMSKLGLIAATKILARENPGVTINCCCPGFCKTDMSSHRGTRDPADGAKNSVIPATMENPPTGAFFSDYKIAQW
jgi:carbonyl reductase 1